MALAFAVLGVALLDTINFTVDDTFIPFRYAENLAEGQGLVYNRGERVEGFSNLLWTLVLSQFARAGWNQGTEPLALLKAAKVSGALLAVATLAVVTALCWHLRRRLPGTRHRDLLMLVPLGTAATYSYALWSVAGLETGLCTFLVTLAAAAFVRALSSQREGRAAFSPWAAGAGIAFGLASLTRPEQILIWAACAGALFFTWRGPARRLVLDMGIPVMVVYASMLAWRLAYYGDLVPNSLVSKSGGGWITAVIGLKYALGGLSSVVGGLALGLLGVRQLVRSRPEWYFLATYCLAFLGFVFASGGDWMPGYRYYVPIVPLLWLLTIGSSVCFLGRVEPRIGAPATAALIVLLAASTFALERSRVRAQQVFPTGIKGVVWHDSPDRIELSREVSRIVPPGATLALFEAGYVPYFNRDIRILDTSGLMDREIARLPGRHMEKLTAEIFLRRRPDYYLMMVRGGIPSGDGATLLRSPEFRERYEIAWRFDNLERALTLAALAPGARMSEERSFVLYRRKD